MLQQTNNFRLHLTIQRETKGIVKDCSQTHTHAHSENWQDQMCLCFQLPQTARIT